MEVTDAVAAHIATVFEPIDERVDRVSDRVSDLRVKLIGLANEFASLRDKCATDALEGALEETERADKARRDAAALAELRCTVARQERDLTMLHAIVRDLRFRKRVAASLSSSSDDDDDDDEQRHDTKRRRRGSVDDLTMH